MPTEKAHGIQIMKTCEAFADVGINIKLFVPSFLFFKKEDPFLYYGIRRVFEIKRLFSIRLIRLGPIGFSIEKFIFFILLVFSKDFWASDYIFSRDEMLTSLASLLGKKTIWEVHVSSYNFFTKIAISRANHIVSISQGLKDYYVAKGVDSGKILVAHDGVDLKMFDASFSQEEARKTLDLPTDKKIVLYTGHLYEWKGVGVLAESAKFFDEDTLFLFVGGTEYDKKIFLDKYQGVKNIRVIGNRPYSEVPMYLKSADVLVLPNSGKSDISKLYTSPMKLFEYMASGVPIVASDLPSMREVLNTSNSTLVKSDSPSALSQGIKTVFDNTGSAGILAKQALHDVDIFSWESRIKKILSVIEK